MPITREELENLCTLARLEVPEEEKEKLRKDLEEILGYVSELKEVQDIASAPEYSLTNVMREDTDPIPPGTFPLVDGYLKVKKILG